MIKLVLASTSPARRALMDALGVPYEAVAPGVDELVSAGLDVRQAVRALAHRKARAVQDRRPKDFVLGADQMANLGGVTLGKPGNREAARKQLKLLSGATHDIVTGLCLLGPSGFEEHHVETTRITLYRLKDEEIERYLDTGEWEGCAGAYRVEGRGQTLMAAIEGDRTNVQGLPMLRLVAMLRNAELL